MLDPVLSDKEARLQIVLALIAENEWGGAADLVDDANTIYAFVRGPEVELSTGGSNFTGLHLVDTSDD